ncbi:thiamine phosphate synthase [Clostridium boliviensis]|uniref:Thiamine-phosphate synthase n=1 Tax=Clostridium boliviensis TaxID=318465 RepID=A0ABU4GSV8_9CLOT|nr:thiamine phosphate synthase [Clostridium boliviensis]MDW2800717.1 thiamine phosphate synthase [Clostridium boliviensis]
MNVSKDNMLLYVVTDRTWLGNSRLCEQVEEIVQSGATFIQLREKNLDYDSFAAEGRAIRTITSKYNIPFVINDNIEVALAVGADGVHVGQKDLDARKCRELIGEDKILGVSAQTKEQALLAEESGADYIGVGAVFETSTKTDANPVSFDTLKEICSSVSIPVIAIGGINEDNIQKLKGSHIDGVAVISAVFAARDKKKAVKTLLSLVKEAVI